VILEAADQAVDRLRAKHRSPDIVKLMADVDYQKAKVALPAYGVGLMQNLSSEDQKAFADQNKALIERTDIADDTKTQLLGLGIMNFMGADVLRAGISALGNGIR
jgi:hypothetical protein